MSESRNDPQNTRAIQAKPQWDPQEKVHESRVSRAGEYPSRTHIPESPIPCAESLRATTCTPAASTTERMPSVSMQKRRSLLGGSEVLLGDGFLTAKAGRLINATEDDRLDGLHHVCHDSRGLTQRTESPIYPYAVPFDRLLTAPDGDAAYKPRSGYMLRGPERYCPRTRTTSRIERAADNTAGSGPRTAPLQKVLSAL